MVSHFVKHRFLKTCFYVKALARIDLQAVSQEVEQERVRVLVHVF
jgi:hypothetical protein